MKLIKTIRVNGTPLALVDDQIRLDLVGPGRASFSVISDKPLSGIVQLDAGYAGQSVQRYFTGYIERCYQQDNQRQLLFCRELSAALNRDLPLALRNVSLRDVLDEIGKQTALEIITPQTDYVVQRVPFFYHLGGGYMALDSCGKVFGIEDFIWQQQGDGSVYVGSWSDSRWASREVTLPDEWLTDQVQADSATIPLMPALRPGVKFNDSYYITSTRLMTDKMVITWSKRLNG